MKEYRIITVPLGYEYEDARQPRTPASIGQAVMDFFNPSDGISPSDGRFITDAAERIMEEMNRGGWEVVSAAPFGTDPTEMLLLVTFSRELS